MMMQIQPRIVPHSVICDKRISWKALGLYMWIVSQNESFTLADMVRAHKDGSQSVSSGIKELKKFGYLDVKPINDNGKFCGSQWTIKGEGHEPS